LARVVRLFLKIVLNKDMSNILVSLGCNDKTQNKMDFEIIGKIDKIETIASGTGFGARARLKKKMQFAICIDNKGYEASLEIGKLYQVIPDEEAAKHGYVKIIDETEEDYAFMASRFHLLSLHMPVEKALLSALRVERTEILEA
jgi:hypothetical protein